MKRKNLLKILGLLILAGNVASAKYLGKLEKTYSKNSDYKMKITSVKSGESKRNVSKILSDQEIDLELIEKIGDSNFFIIIENWMVLNQLDLRNWMKDLRHMKVFFLIMEKKLRE